MRRMRQRLTIWLGALATVTSLIALSMYFFAPLYPVTVNGVPSQMAIVSINRGALLYALWPFIGFPVSSICVGAVALAIGTWLFARQRVRFGVALLWLGTLGLLAGATYPDLLLFIALPALLALGAAACSAFDLRARVGAPTT